MSERPDERAGGRVLLLLALLATGALWLEHHLGFGIARLGGVAVVLGLWGSMEKLAGSLGQQSALRQFVERIIKSPLQRGFRYAAEPGPLRVVIVVLAVLMATVSSVTVVKEAAGETALVTIAPLDPPGRPRSGRLGTEQPQVRFRPVLTSPFGRLFRIDAEGYAPAAIPVYPLVGRRVVLGRDLAPSPAVLFRPFVLGTSALHDGAVFRVRRVSARGDEVVASDTGHAAAFWLGRMDRVTESMLTAWGLELQAERAPESEQARFLAMWRKPRHLAMPGELGPSDRLVAEILEGDRIVSRIELTLRGERFVDVMLEDVPE